jgi:hypothetical protein
MLWDAGGLLNATFWNYHRLREEVQAELPLKRIWALALLEAEELRPGIGKFHSG